MFDCPHSETQTVLNQNFFIFSRGFTKTPQVHRNVNELEPTA